jgi:hypothetical protein
VRVVELDEAESGVQALSVARHEHKATEVADVRMFENAASDRVETIPNRLANGADAIHCKR